MRVQDQEEKNIKSLLHGFSLEGSTNAFNQEMKLKEELIFWRTKMEGKVRFKDLFCLKLLQIGPYVLRPWLPT